MSGKAIFLATHPRSCSTAFERVFMTRRDELKCVHEPFGDAFYYGPERLSQRYDNDEQARIDSGFAESTYKTVVERIDKENSEGKRLFIKDIAHYLLPPNGGKSKLAPSLGDSKRLLGSKDFDNPNGISNVISDCATFDLSNGNSKMLSHSKSNCIDGDEGNPTVIPSSVLERFHFTFLIRNPRASIPSYYRCTVPPLDEITQFFNFMPSEAGYDETRRLFDYLRSIGQIGPQIAGRSIADDVNGFAGNTTNEKNKISICVVDADDLLENPSGIIRAYCKSVGFQYKAEMLNWDTEEDHAYARKAFEKWKGFHEDAINSCCLKGRAYKKYKPSAEEDAEWAEKFGSEGAKVIRECVEENMADYEYLKQFAIRATSTDELPN